jgi:hypothetical protein
MGKKKRTVQAAEEAGGKYDKPISFHPFRLRDVLSAFMKVVPRKVGERKGKK